MSAWQELPISSEDLPVTVRLKGVRIRAWQGIPDVTVDTADQVEILSAPPWDDSIDLNNHCVEIPLTEMVAGPSRVGIQTTGLIVSVRDDSGLILRCTECRRVLRNGECADHGPNEGNEDVRLRLVVDHGGSTAAVLVNKEATLASLGMTIEALHASVDEHGEDGFVQRVREILLGRTVVASGRSIVDDQGAMLLSDKLELPEKDSQLRATELRSLWGWA